jgi:uncharacterized delta-60 repeat protein
MFGAAAREGMPTSRIEKLEDRRLLSAGQLDSYFGTAGKTLINLAHATPMDIIVLPDSRILMAGRISGTVNTLFLARFNANGIPDKSFGGRNGAPTGVLFTNMPIGGSVQIEALDNGQILMVAGGQLARFNSNGSLDPKFLRNQFTLLGNFIATSIDVDAQGRIIVAGRHYLPVEEPTSAFAVTRCNANGSLDTSFAGDGLFTYMDSVNGTGQAVRVLPDGNVIVSGYLDRGYPDDMTEYRREDMIALKLDKTGSLVSSYGQGGIATKAGSYFASASVSTCISPDGTATHITYSDYDRVTKFSPAGVLDPNFGFTDGVGDKSPHSILVQSDGKVVFVGTEFPSGNGATSDFVTRTTATGAFDSTFGTNGHTTLKLGVGDNTFTDVTFAQDGSILVAGISTDRIVLARYWRDEAPAEQAFAKTRTSAGTDSYRFKVTVRDDVSIKASTLTATAFRVIGPDGKSYATQLVGIDSHAAPGMYVVNLKLKAVGGAWNAADNGRYKIQVLSKRISDKAGHFSSGRTIGSFVVNVPATSSVQSRQAQRQPLTTWDI